MGHESVTHTTNRQPQQRAERNTTMTKLIAVGNTHEKEIINKLESAGFRYQGRSDNRKLYAHNNGTLVMIITVYPKESYR